MFYISMSQKDLDRYEIIQRSLRKEITVEKAGELLSISERQVYRLRNKIKQNGAQGLIHISRGRPSNRKIPDKEQQKIIKLLHKHYYDFKPTHAAEKLQAHSINRDPKTIRQIMIDQGLWKPSKRKQAKYRCQRPRKEHFGEMQQFDGSYEKWFEDRGPQDWCLLAAIDDATGTITKAQFAPHEGTLPVFSFWKDYFAQHGKPRSIYLDKLRTYYNNHPCARDAEEMLTQFQRAMRQLGIEPIVAHSPQAKGRIERLFGTLQNRLIKEMRLKNISAPETANQFLEQEFIPWFNNRYAVLAKSKADLHRKLTRQEKGQLPSILSRHSHRTVSQDFTIRFNNKYYQLLKDQPATICPRERVIIEQRIDGSLWIGLRTKYLNYKELLHRPKKQESLPWVIAANQKPKPEKSKAPKPAKDHPWRRPFILSPAKRYQTSSLVEIGS